MRSLYALYCTTASVIVVPKFGLREGGWLLITVMVIIGTQVALGTKEV